MVSPAGEQTHSATSEQQATRRARARPHTGTHRLVCGSALVGTVSDAPDECCCALGHAAARCGLYRGLNELLVTREPRSPELRLILFVNIVDLKYGDNQMAF